MVEPAGALPPCPQCGKDHAESLLKCPETDMLLPLRGRLLDGKFRLVQPIGKGGMAEVWLAVNERVDRRVAIKLIRPEVARDDALVGRFRAEARAAGRIGHRDICDILDSGVSPIGPFIVMELLRGRSLGDVITRRGALPHGPVVAIVRQALEGLRAAHDIGIVHRDLKPENVFLHRGDRGEIVVKLMDFGVAKFTDGTGEVRTEHGALLGTPEYMAPEQFKGAAHADVRTDIWALGAILYRALTGHNAFSGPTIAAILLSVASEDPKPFRERAPNVPPGLATIVLRCLAKNPAARYVSVAALSEALARFDTGLDGIGDWLEDPPEPTTEEIAADFDAPIGDESPPEPPAEPLFDAPAASIDEEQMDTTAPRAVPPPVQASRPWGRIALGAVLLGVMSYAAYEITREPEPIVPTPQVEPAVVEDERDPPPANVPTQEPTPTRTQPEPLQPPPPIDPLPPEPAATGGLDVPPPPPTEPDPSASESTGAHDDDPTPAPPPDPSGAPATAPGTLVHAGGYVTPAKPGPAGRHRDAKRWCEGLARVAYLGISSWHMPNPKTASKFIGNKSIKKARYWTSALHHGRGLVISLPGGDKASVSASQRSPRTLCVARSP